MNLKAALFDFDGTLVDSERFHFTCASELFQPYGISFDFQYYLDNFAGIPLPDNAKTIVERFRPAITAEEIVHQYEEYSFERMQSYHFQLMPFAIEALQYFQKRDIPIAIATGSRREDVDTIMDKTDLKSYVEFEVTRSEVKKSKPDPETYQTCIDRLGFPQENYIVFEDTTNGAKSAKAAGLTCWAVQSNEKDHHKLSMADRLFLSFKEAIEELPD